MIWDNDFDKEQTGMQETKPAQLKLLVGNIGTGKSTFARRLARDFGDVVVNTDNIIKMISGGDYYYCPEKSAVYGKATNAIIESALQNYQSVVVDRTNIDVKTRKRYIVIAKKFNVPVIAYDFGKGEPFSLNRRLKSPKGETEQTWKEVYNVFLQKHEELSSKEGITQIIKMPKKHIFYSFDFDGVIVKNEFPRIVTINAKIVNKMRTMRNDFGKIIIINTCRSGDYENKMYRFLLENSIPFDFINENPFFETGSRKIFAHQYYDDRNASIEQKVRNYNKRG